MTLNRKLIGCLMTTSLTAPLVFAQTPRAAPRASTVIVRGGGSFLGVGVEEINSERAKALKLKEEQGVEVRSVDQDSPASKAGLKEGDVILQYNGQRVEGVDQLVRMVSETPVGRRATLLISRSGSQQTLTTTIEARKPGDHFGWYSYTVPPVPPAPTAPPSTAMPPMPPMPPDIQDFFHDMPRASIAWGSPMLGIDSETLNPQLAEFFGVKEGVLVRAVTSRSPAEKAGIKAGDVITKVNGTAVNAPREITAALRSAVRSKKDATCTIVRNRKEMTLDVKLEESSHLGDHSDRDVL